MPCSPQLGLFSIPACEDIDILLAPERRLWTCANPQLLSALPLQYVMLPVDKLCSLLPLMKAYVVYRGTADALWNGQTTTLQT